MSPHRVVDSPLLATPTGFAHAIVAAPGALVHLAGQTAQDRDGQIAGTTMAEQFDVAAGNVVTALRAAGGVPEDLVSMTVYVTDVGAYRAALRPLGRLWRKHFGRHYPAMALLGVRELFDATAMIEMVAVAVVPRQSEVD
ncbi:RidA family protein [Amycolatopsis pithecellobii]|uniref:RidA family protein n=1 Tax=Amycolatopsis pithecellobii TaxID=664692 RepID=A0A6N7YSN5_9PSEU|nr:RidA family protein [Amycolatopsis pithecellobii]MTD56047.1 RidA family protein [Amycolatopsis pithecellobii]